MFAIKAEVSDPGAKAFAFSEQKTMYGGKHIAGGDTIFVFASENEGGSGLIARGVDGRPETELNFKFYRQATNKIAGISDEAAAFLRGFF